MAPVSQKCLDGASRVYRLNRAAANLSTVAVENNNMLFYQAKLLHYILGPD